MSRMNILAIISRDLQKGSTKYRIAQYLEFLESKGINIEFIKRTAIDASIVKKAGQFDLVFNQKCLFRYSLAKKLLVGSRQTLFDFDDAIYTRPGKPHSFLTGLRVKSRLHLWLKRSNIVTTSNHFLARYAQKYSKSVEVIPMALNLDTWKPTEKSVSGNITIGWAGAPVNVPLIESLDPVLSFLLKKYPFLKLAIFSGQKPRLSCPFEYHSFQPGHEPAFVKSLDIGLLPLNVEEYSKGKSPIKAIQYLACGVPVVGNVIGATGEILNEQNSIAVSNEDEWIRGLEKLITNRDLARSMGRVGCEYVQKNHNVKSVAEQFFRILSGN
jgi:glycosyltransferase involved in cell wall biosynthesis